MLAHLLRHNFSRRAIEMPHTRPTNSILMLTESQQQNTCYYTGLINIAWLSAWVTAVSKINDSYVLLWRTFGMLGRKQPGNEQMASKCATISKIASLFVKILTKHSENVHVLKIPRKFQYYLSSQITNYTLMGSQNSRGYKKARNFSQISLVDEHILQIYWSTQFMRKITLISSDTIWYMYLKIYQMLFMAYKSGVPSIFECLCSSSNRNNN